MAQGSNKPYEESGEAPRPSATCSMSASIREQVVRCSETSIASAQVLPGELDTLGSRARSTIPSATQLLFERDSFDYVLATTLALPDTIPSPSASHQMGNDGVVVSNRSSVEISCRE